MRPFCCPAGYFFGPFSTNSHVGFDQGNDVPRKTPSQNVSGSLTIHPSTIPEKTISQPVQLRPHARAAAEAHGSRQKGEWGVVPRGSYNNSPNNYASRGPRVPRQVHGPRARLVGSAQAHVECRSPQTYVSRTYLVVGSHTSCRGKSLPEKREEVAGARVFFFVADDHHFMLFPVQSFSSSRDARGRSEGANSLARTDKRKEASEHQKK
jgi:hypothetical protein